MKNEHGYCPNCNLDFDGGSIWEHFFKETGSEDEADRIAKMYGATRTHGQWGRQIGRYDLDKDRVVSWECPACNYSFERGRHNHERI